MDAKLIIKIKIHSKINKLATLFTFAINLIETIMNLEDAQMKQFASFISPQHVHIRIKNIENILRR